MICPQCRTPNTMLTADGGALCFECRFEWNPHELVAGPPPLIQPFAMATVEEVFGPPPEVARADELAAAHAEVEAALAAVDAATRGAPFEIDDLLGQVATLEGGQQALIIGTDGFGPLTVVTATGHELTVPLSDVVAVVPVPDVPEDLPTVHEGDQQKEAT